jgi:hypothetical protein
MTGNITTNATNAWTTKRAGNMDEKFTICINGKQMPCTFIRNLKVRKDRKQRKVKVPKFVTVENETTKLHFCNRTSAIMWLKHHGTEFAPYKLNDKWVVMVNHYVWFLDDNTEKDVWRTIIGSEKRKLGMSAESKRTCKFAKRNN